MATTPAGTRTLGQRAADNALGEPVEEWLQRQRDAGKSYRQIERALLTEADLDFTSMTLRSWLAAYQSRQEVGAA